MKVTYLLGAGASAQALPMIKSNKENNSTKGLPESLKEFLLEYESSWTQKTINGETGLDKNMVSKIETLKHIADNCIEFGTPDLYAKFLNESKPFDQEKYILLKLLISNYFSLEQYSDFMGRSNGHGAFDKRALVFLSTISEKGSIPSNVKVITWNYDEQLEIANSKMNSRGEVILKSWPNQHPNYTGDYFLMHLNGVAGWDYSTGTVLPQVKEFTTYKNFEITRNPMLSFAWEDEEREDFQMFFKQRMDFLNKMVLDTEILVIIGYSFPFFNRKIDKEIFRLLKHNCQIFYQDPEAENKIPLIKKLFHIEQNIEPILYTDQYFVPFEL